MAQLEDVPVELLQKNIVAHLVAKDAVALASCSKTMHRSLSLSTVTLEDPLISAYTIHGSVEEGEIPVFVTSIPLLFRNRVHSVVIDGVWRDQGWGNCKGMAYIVSNAAGSFRGRRVAQTARTAGHNPTDFRMAFLVDSLRDHQYSFWCKAGGGGGHSLCISHAHVRLVLYDCPGRYLSRNYTAMRNQGALRNETGFHFQLLRIAVQTLLTQITVSSPRRDRMNLMDFFESAGILLNKESLEAMLELVASMEQYTNEKFANEGELQRKLVLVRSLCEAGPTGEGTNNDTDRADVNNENEHNNNGGGGADAAGINGGNDHLNVGAAERRFRVLVQRRLRRRQRLEQQGRFDRREAPMPDGMDDPMVGNEGIPRRFGGLDEMDMEFDDQMMLEMDEFDELWGL